MKVSLIQVDGKWANLALMKLSTYHKMLGDSVCLDGVSGDVVYISCIFTKNRAKAMGIAQFYKNLGAKVIVGGSGIDLKTRLSPEIEKLQPDFELYSLDYSLGFSSRGCIRDCDFCVVPKKEGMIREVGLDWIRHEHVKLLDNNFLASPKAEKKLQYFIDNDLKVCFTQGLDIRLVTPKFADLLSKTKSLSNSWKSKCYYFAFDDLSLKSVIQQKIDLLHKYGISSNRILFYVLCGFNSTHEEDMERVKFLHNNKCMAFVMKYHNKSSVLNRFANWCNGRYYQFVEFKDFNKPKWRRRRKLGIPFNKKLTT